VVDTTGPGPTISRDSSGAPVYRPGLEESATGAPLDVRIERVSLGELPVPRHAYWGVHTARALENFPITRRAISNHPDLITALAWVKQAAARANRD